MVEEEKAINKIFMGFVLRSTNVSPGWFQSKENLAWFPAKVFRKTILGLLNGSTEDTIYRKKHRFFNNKQIWYSVKSIQVLHKAYSDVNQSELIFYFRYVLCIIYLYENLNQSVKRLSYSC